MKNINRFLNQDGKVKIWPSKRKNQLEILNFLIDKFKDNIVYSEKDINNILNEYHTFNDYALLRRELINNKLLIRSINTSEYWKA